MPPVPSPAVYRDTATAFHPWQTLDAPAACSARTQLQIHPGAESSDEDLKRGGTLGLLDARGYPLGMSTLAEIEAAVDRLPDEQKQELLLFLAMRLRAGVPSPEPREFSPQQLAGWIEEDEADLRNLSEPQ